MAFCFEKLSAHTLWKKKKRCEGLNSAVSYCLNCNTNLYHLKVYEHICNSCLTRLYLTIYVCISQ